ncbi:MAG TPA: DUF1569 domain-containing protein [Pirellulales bacterium]
MSASTETVQKQGRINTKRVQGRRELHFSTLSEVQKDAERLAAGQVRQLGNWPLGYALAHMAGAMKMSLDGAEFRAPFYIRLLAPLIKKGLLRGPMKPGFQLPQQATRDLLPLEPISTEEGLNALRKNIERLTRKPNRAPSPVFGAMTREEWDQLHLRHAELHLSFYVPE